MSHETKKYKHHKLKYGYHYGFSDGPSESINSTVPFMAVRYGPNGASSRQHYTPLVYIYKAKHDQEYCIERMKDSLSKILVHYYPVAGRLSFTQNGRMEIDCNAKGIILQEAETTKTMADFGDFSPSDSTKELVPIIDYTQPIEELPLLVLQLTRFNGDEGLAVGVAWLHTLSDGLGCTRFIGSWAKIARGDTLDPHEMPFLDRTLLKFSHPPLAPRFEHKELKPLPLILGSSDCSAQKNKKVISEVLKLTPQQVEKLKKTANVDFQKGSRLYSRFEVIGAHIWRCASKARELDQNQPTEVRFNAENRSRMVPSLPSNYFGTALSQTVTTGYVGEITSKPLSHAAQKIREAIEMVSDDYIRSQIDVIRCQEHLDDARALFLGVKGKNAQFGGNPNLHLTSWMSMPTYEVDFGWGKPVYFGLAYESPHDRAIILLSPDGDGSVNVLMFFQMAHMQLFKKFFYADISTSDRALPARL